MSTQLEYPKEDRDGALTSAVLGRLSREDANLNNVTFYQSGGVRKYALTRFPLPTDTATPKRVGEVYNRWLSLCRLNGYVAMKQFHGAIKESDECAYLVADYFPGGSLDDTNVVNDLSPTEAMIVIVGILGQLAMLHKKGLVHRTLSPSRIVLDKDKYPHIVGWSRVYENSSDEVTDDDSQGSGVSYGGLSSCFIPPEMTPKSGPALPGVDIWSFAMICLWLVDCRNNYFGSFNRPVDLARAKGHLGQILEGISISIEFQQLLAGCFIAEYEERPTAGTLLQRILQERIGLNNTNWSRVDEYARANIRSEDGTETLESFFEACEYGSDEEDEEEEEALE